MNKLPLKGPLASTLQQTSYHQNPMDGCQDICSLWSVVKYAGQRNQQTFSKYKSANSCWLWMIPIANKKAKRVNMNKASIYPKQPETCLAVYS